MTHTRAENVIFMTDPRMWRDEASASSDPTEAEALCVEIQRDLVSLGHEGRVEELRAVRVMITALMRKSM
jgi:hypothetical protein